MRDTCEQVTIVAAKVADTLPQLGLMAGETFYLAWDHRELRLFVVQWELTRWTCTCGQHGCAHRLAANQYVFEQTMNKNRY